MFESSFWTFRSHQNYFPFSLAIGRVLFTGRSPSTFQCQQPIPSQRPPARFFSVAYSQVICSAPLASLINDQRGSANSGRRPSPNNGQASLFWWLIYLRNRTKNHKTVILTIVAHCFGNLNPQKSQARIDTNYKIGPRRFGVVPAKLCLKNG